MKKRMGQGIALGVLCAVVLSQTVYASSLLNTTNNSNTVSAANTQTEQSSSESSISTSGSTESSDTSSSITSTDSSTDTSSSSTTTDSSTGTSNSSTSTDSSTDSSSSSTQNDSSATDSSTTSGSSSNTETSTSTDTSMATDNYTLSFSAVVSYSLLEIDGLSSDSSVTLSIVDSSGVEKVNKTLKVKSGSFSKDISANDLKAGETYEITVTDTDSHQSTRSVTMPIKVKDISISDYTKDLKVGSTLTISATILPSTATNQTITYTSSDPSIATVDGTGKVTGIAAGAITIVLSVDDVQKEIPVNVYIETTKIELNQTFCTLQPGETFPIKTTVFPSDAVQTCTFKSTDTDIATVSEKGVVTAKKKGSTSIIISNGHKDVTATILVNDGSDSSVTESSESAINPDAVSVSSNSELVQAIQNSTENTVTIQDNENLVLDAELLNLLKDSQKTLIIEKAAYQISISGADILNPENTLDTTLVLTEEKNGNAFILNGETKLPGKVTISFTDQTFSKKPYLYLYNTAKHKYEYISQATRNGSLEIENNGKYLLTNHKLTSYTLQLAAVGGASAFCVVLGVGYFFMKRKYLFW